MSVIEVNLVVYWKAKSSSSCLYVSRNSDCSMVRRLNLSILVEVKSGFVLLVILKLVGM